MKKMQLKFKKQIIIFTLICIIASFIASSTCDITFALAPESSGKKIAEASCNENGGFYGGTPGDQTGDEVRIKYYSEDSNNRWTCYRYKPDDDSKKIENIRNTIEQMACNGANNPNIGYDMTTNGRLGCFNQMKSLTSHDLKDINVPVNTDCSGFVGTCIVATGYILNDETLKSYQPFGTSNMHNQLTSHGFEEVTDLLAGDILVRRGHTAIYVGDAALTNSSPYKSNTKGTILTAEKINTYYDNAVNFDSQNFQYNGSPKEMGIIEKKSLSGIIDSIKNIINYIFGFLVSGIRMAIVGFAEAIESLINGALLSIEGITDLQEQADQPEYSIEDLLYNRIPALDVNIFSTTPGGKQIINGSTLSIIRNLVAGWYYSMRNIAAIIMFIILLYTGLRMAISTSVEDKASYSEQFITWLKCMTLLFVIHYVMILILQLNDTLIKLFATASTGVGSLHDTIEARAYDMRFTVGISGMIMYVTLIVYWIKFLLLYIRRYIYNIIYIVLAPFAIVRYAMDNANTKGKSGFESWLNKFIANIIIQPAHALAYTVFMSVAVNLALESIGGFIIALVFMSQILKMDEYVLGIVRFNGNDASGHLHKMKKPMREEWPLIAYGQIRYATGLTKNVGTLATGIARPAGNYVKYRNYGNKKPGLIAKKLNKHDQKSIDKALKRIEENKANVEKQGINNPKMSRKLNRKIAKDQQKIENMKFNISVRNNDAEAKKILKLKKDNRKQVYKASATAIKNVLGTVAGVATAIPLAVAESPEAGLVAAKMITSPIEHISNYKKVVKKQDKLNKKKDKIQNTIVLVNKAHEISSSIEKSINKVEESSNIDDIKSELKKVDRLNANSENVKNLLAEEQVNNQDDNIQDSVKKVLNKMDTNKELNEKQKQDLAEKETKNIKENYNLDNDDKINSIDTDEDITNVANVFSKDITEEVVSDRSIELAKKINELKDLNEKAKEENDGADIKVIDIDKFIDNLGSLNKNNKDND